MYSDRLVRLVNRNAKRAYRLPSGPQPSLLGGRGDKDLGQVDHADEPHDVLLVPAAEELARLGVVRVGAIKRADQDIGVEDDLQFSAAVLGNCWEAAGDQCARAVG